MMRYTATILKVTALLFLLAAAAVVLSVASLTLLRRQLPGAAHA